MTRIPDRCNGRPGAPGYITWSDDSYASYGYRCKGCPDCKPVQAPAGTLTGRMSAAKPNLSNPPVYVPYNGPWDALPKGDT